MDKKSRNRYSQWMMDYFPEPKYSEDEVRDYISNTNPNLPNKYKENIVEDWVNFMADIIEDEIKTKPSIWQRIKKFLGRLF